MKQTNNAIKFLMAQYRAIFKNAYFKGMATALVLTAGLAAGQAQAAYTGDNDYFGLSGSGTDITSTSTAASGSWEDTSTGDLPNTDYHIAGAVGETSASGGRLEVDRNNSVSGSALGGIVVSTSNLGSLTATDNALNLLSGAQIGQSAYGAYVNATSGGNVSATNNRVILDGIGSGESVTVTTRTGSGDGIFGARIKSSNGSATATGNYVDITAHYGATLTLNHGDNGIVGALAEGTDFVSVTGNKVIITGTNTGNALTNRLSLGTAGNTAHTLIGGFALNQSSDADGGSADTLISANNIVSGSNFSFGGSSGAAIFGGRAMNTDAAQGASEIIARDNTVSLSNTAITNTSTTGTDLLQIIGNVAVATPTAAPTSGQNSVKAQGDGATVNLLIDGGEIDFITSGNATPGISNGSSMAAGGYAMTSSGGGNAAAISNVANIKNLSATNVNFYGGYANSVANTGDDQVEASQNTLTIDNATLLADNSAYKNYTQNSLVGGLAELGSTGDLSKAAATASNNTLTITNSSYSANDLATAKNVAVNIYGAAVVTKNSGATVTANQNAVSVGNGLRVDGSVYGVQSSYNGTFTGNTVSFDATLTGAANSTGVIAGVGIETGTSGSDADNLATISLLNNTVTLGTNARVTNTSIVGAQLADDNSTNNDVIHSGNNVIVNGVYLVDDTTSGKTYSLAGDDVQINGTAVIHVKEGTLNISGLSNGADSDPDYFNGTGTVAAGAKIANNGTINVYNALDVQGDESLIATADKALINVNAGLHAEETADRDPVTESKATLYITQQGLTNYLTGSDTRTTLYDQVEVGDKAGTLNVTSGGTVDFKTTVTLNDFSFSSANAESAAEAGKIHVSGTASADNYVANFRADTVNLEHALVTDTKTLRADLNNIDTLAFDNTGAIASTFSTEL